MATKFSPCKGSYVLNQFPSNVMFDMNGFHLSASGAIQGHHGPLVFSCPQIVPIKALRTDYSQPQDKRTLAKAYDLFLCDKRVISLLPGLLGKSFYSRKK